MSRLPVRFRLTLAFALAMAVVLAGVGALLHVRLGASLQEQLDESLETRAAAVASLLEEREGVLGPLDLAPPTEEGFVQVLAPDGAVVASSLSSRPSVAGPELARARIGAFFARAEGVPGLGDEAVRLFVSSTGTGRGERFVVAGASLEDRDEALDGLLAQLLLAGPIALVLSSLAGHLLAGAALRPVEAMRARAAEISSERSGQRLPLPESRDELRRLGETLNDMLARLESGIARERRFVADASHELRTPLSLLRTELELALRRPRTREELEAAVRSTAEDVDRLVRLAEDLLTLAALDEGRPPPPRSPIDARDLLEAVARRFAARAAEAGREIVVTAPAGPPVLGDRPRLEQAVGDLVDNALRHGAGTVRLHAEARDGRVELGVGDEGRGFPPDFLPHAFDRFTRADEARAGGASGLGLAIVAAIARAGDGAARASNREPRGALVTLSLPAVQEPPPA